MKKILLVLLLIFLGHSAFAMYCWEEVSGQFSHESKMTEKLGASNIVKVSTMLTAAGATYYQCSHATNTDSYSDTWQSSFTSSDKYWTRTNQIWSYVTTATNAALNGSSSARYSNRYYCTSTTINGKFQIYGDNFEDYPTGTTVTNSFSGGPAISKPGITTGRLYTYISYGGVGAPYEKPIYACTDGEYCTGSGQEFLNHINYYYTKHNYYVLHNPHYTHTFCTTVGGGGGGAAGAAVNYIIKAD